MIDAAPTPAAVEPWRVAGSSSAAARWRRGLAGDSLAADGR